MHLGLDGRRAVVAAATSGLGRAAAEALVAEGARVVIGGSDRDRAETAAVEIGSGTGFLVADLTDPDECARFVRDAAAMLGGIDALIVNGPGPPPGDFAGTAYADYPAALDRSLLSVVAMCTEAVPAMRAQRFGRIVAITSLSVRQPIPNLILSTTARAGATGFLKTLAREVAADGVTVNSVLPGLHDTARVRAVFGDALDAEIDDIPAGVLGRPADFGAVVAFLCSDAARYVTGVALPVDGGSDRGLY